MTHDIVAIGGLPLSLPASVVTETGWRAIEERYAAMQEAETAGGKGRWRKPGSVEQLAEKHYGPGPHPGTGTTQEAHAGGASGLAFAQYGQVGAGPKSIELQIEPQHVDDYWAAMAFDGPEAQEMLQRVGETPQTARQMIAAARHVVDNTPQTRGLHFKNGAYTPERQRLHEEIISKLLRGPEGLAEPSLFLTGGLPGAGKSGALDLPLYRGYKERHALIDSDAIKELLARADGIEQLGARAASYHAESDDVIESAFLQAARRRMNIGLDGTLKSLGKVEAMVDKFTRLGYRTEVMFVDLPVKKAMLRAIGRFLGGGRFVDPIYIASHDSRNRRTMEALKAKVQRWRHWDVDVPFGQPPRLIAEGGF